MISFVHLRTGKVYVFEGPAFNKSAGRDGERMVVYRSLGGIRYVRTEKEFNEKFKLVQPESVTTTQQS